MKNFRTAMLSAALVFSTSASYAANEWGIDGEEKARFPGKVVDIACELTGDCPDNCGDGKRQLGLVREDGTLLLVMKNFDTFAGGVNDLIAFCGKTIEADGLLIKTPHMPVFAIQFKREIGGKWSRANQFSKDWAAANGQKANQWFRKDPAVIKEIKTNGIFGVPGLEPEPE